MTAAALDAAPVTRPANTRDRRRPAPNAASLADARAIARMADGDADALAELYDRYSRVVYGMAYRLLGDAGLAEECTQDVLLVAWRRAGSYKPDRARVSTWLFAITRNRAIELARRRQARPAEPYADVDAPGEAPDPSVLAARAETTQQIAEAMCELPKAQAEALRLAYFEGLTHVEVAECLGIPVGTVKGRIRLGLDRLRAVADRYALAA
jgi:RNA polymerase sigma-70 factor (ECF subfamily)